MRDETQAAKSPLGNETHADSDEISDRNGDQGEQTLNNEIEPVVSGPVATLAWLVLVAIITVVAAIGIVCEHGPTATAILAAIAIVIGLFAAIATLRKSKGSNILAVTAALSAFVGLLVSQADTIQEIVTKPDAKTAIVSVVLLVTIFLGFVIFQRNGENDQPGNRRDQTSPVTATSEEEVDE